MNNTKIIPIAWRFIIFIPTSIQSAFVNKSIEFSQKVTEDLNKMLICTPIQIQWTTYFIAVEQNWCKIRAFQNALYYSHTEKCKPDEHYTKLRLKEPVKWHSLRLKSKSGNPPVRFTSAKNAFGDLKLEEMSNSLTERPMFCTQNVSDYSSLFPLSL